MQVMQHYLAKTRLHSQYQASITETEKTGLQRRLVETSEDLLAAMLLIHPTRKSTAIAAARERLIDAYIDIVPAGTQEQKYAAAVQLLENFEKAILHDIISHQKGFALSIAHASSPGINGKC